MSKFTKILLISNLLGFSLSFAAQEKFTTDLHTAIYSDNPEYVKDIVDLGLNIYQKDSLNRSAADMAANYENVKILNLLVSTLRKQSKVAFQEKNKLHRAVLMCDYKEINKLINSKADINEINTNGDTALHLAERQHNLIMSDYLKKLGAVDKTNSKGEKPSDYTENLNQKIKETAEKYSKPKVTEIPEVVGINIAPARNPNFVKISAKVEKKAEINNQAEQANNASFEKLKIIFIKAVQNKEFKLIMKLFEKEPKFFNDRDCLVNALNIIIQVGDISNFEYLLANPKVNKLIQDPKDSILFKFIAVNYNQLLILEKLLKYNHDINHISKKKDITLLMDAARLGYDEILELLLKYGAKINLQNSKGYSALYYALSNLHFSTAELLIKKGASLEVKDKELNATPLLLFANVGTEDVLEFLIAHGADLKVKDKNDDLALAHAISAGSKKCVQALLDTGQFFNEEIGNNLTPLGYAAFYGKKGIVKYLLSRGFDANAKSKSGYTALCEAIIGNHLEVVKLLLGKGADAKITCNGSSPLMEACIVGNIEIIKLLLPVSDINYNKKCGCSALGEAVLKDRLDVIKLLVKAGADLENSGCHNTSALMVAASEGHIDTIEYLIEAGANIDAKDKIGDTAYTLAKQAKKYNVCNLLTKYQKQESLQPFDKLRVSDQEFKPAQNRVIAQIHQDREQAELQRKRNNSAALLQAILSGDKELAKKLNFEGNKLFGLDDTKENRKLLHDILEEKPERKHEKLEQPIVTVNKPAKAKSGHNKKKKNKPAAAKSQAKSQKEYYVQSKPEQLPKPEPISDDVYEAVLASLNRDSSVLELLSQKNETEEKVEQEPQDLEPIYIDYGNQKIKVDIAHVIQGFAGNDGLYHGLHIDFNRSLERKNKLKTVKVYPNACYEAEIIDQELLEQINKNYFAEVKKSLYSHLDSKHSNLVLGYLASENNRKSFFPYKWDKDKLTEAIADALHNIKSFGREGNNIVIIGERLPKNGEDARFSIKIKIILSIKNGEAVIKTAYPIK